MVRVVVVVGTRPEAIRLAPVVAALDEAHDLAPWVIATGPQPDAAIDALDTYGLAPDVVLDPPVTTHGDGQGDLVGHLLPGVDRAVADAEAGAVVVHGGGGSALAGALAGFWHQVPVVHVEAGATPAPPVDHRTIVERIATRHLVPTPSAAARLTDGTDPAAVVVTGDTIVDATVLCSERHRRATPPGLGDRRLALLTLERPETRGAPLERILRAARTVIDATPDLRLVVPVPPEVHDAVHATLGAHPRVVLSGPLPHPGRIWLLSQAAVVLTDAGSVEEEAPTFGTPVVVLRDTTERPEGVAAGTAWLVGTAQEDIVDRTTTLLASWSPATAPANPFGDGRAARRVIGSLRELVHGSARPADWSPDGAPPETGLTDDERAALEDGLRRPMLFEPVVIEPLVPTDPAGMLDGLPPVAPVSVPSRTERLRRELVDAVPDGLRLGPPTPTQRTREDDAIGEVVEHRRGTQILRHLPDLSPTWPHPGSDVRVWRVALDEGEVWMETAGWPIELSLGGTCTATVSGGAATARWDIARGLVRVTVISGRVDVQPVDGPGRALGPRQMIEVLAAGDLGREERLGPDRLDDDPWVGANRRLSHAHPASRQPAVDTLMLLSDL